jgi:hypothetical protein
MPLAKDATGRYGVRMAAYKEEPTVLESSPSDATVRARLNEPFQEWSVEARVTTSLTGSRISELLLRIDDPVDRLLDDPDAELVPGLSAKLLRSIALDPLEVAARRAMSRDAEVMVEVLDARRSKREEAAAEEGRRQGRPPLTAEHHTRVAVAYLELQRQGRSRGIIKELAKALDVTPTKASDWVHRARKAGFLSPAIPGRPGAEPGPALTGKE